jgi:hypothetical protein
LTNYCSDERKSIDEDRNVRARTRMDISDKLQESITLYQKIKTQKTSLPHM